MKQFLLVRDVMTPDPAVIAPADDAHSAREKMCDVVCRHLPVMDGGSVVGIVSSKDLVRTDACIAELMTSNPASISPDSTIEVAAATMSFLKVSCVPVVHESRLVGIVTTHDLLGAFVRLLDGETVSRWAAC